MKIGDKFIIKTGCVGQSFHYDEGDKGTITRENAEYMEGLIRGGLATIADTHFQDTGANSGQKTSPNIPNTTNPDGRRADEAIDVQSASDNLRPTNSGRKNPRAGKS